MTTPLPEPSHSGPDGTGTYFDSYTAADLRDYGAKCEKTLTAALQAMTAERDELRADAELGRIAMKFVDRAGDYCDIDPAERICDQFYKAIADQVMAHRDAAMKGKS